MYNFSTGIYCKVFSKMIFFRMRFEVGAIIRATSYKQTAKPAIQITKQFLSKFSCADGALIPVSNILGVKKGRVCRGGKKFFALDFFWDSPSPGLPWFSFETFLPQFLRFKLCCKRFQIPWNESIGSKYATDTN